MSSKVKGIKGELTIGRFVIPYRVYNDKGEQVICVNGVQQSMAMWHSLVERFSSRYQMVLFDFPNQGKAKILSGSTQVTLDEQVSILLAVMDKTGIKPDARLSAASWGGVVAVALAAKYPQRVKRLILASLGTKPNKKMVETIEKGFAMGIKNRDQMAKILIDSFGESLPANFKRGIVKQFREMKDGSVQAFCEHGMFVISSKRLSDVVDLSKVQAKTIVLSGEKDTIVDMDDVKFLVSQIPHCKHIQIPDVGHFLHMEKTEVLDVYEDILR